MEIIKLTTELIGDELCDAEKYAKLANHWKEECPDAAKIFNDLANAEIDHHAKLHDLVVKLITKARAEKGAPSAEMKAVYDYLHGKNMEKAAAVMAYIKLYNM